MKRNKKAQPDGLKTLKTLFVNTPRRKRLSKEEARKVALGFLVRDVRDGCSVTQVELAKRMKTTQGVISRIEEGRYQGLKIETVAKIAHALGVSFSLTMGKESIGGHKL